MYNLDTDIVTLAEHGHEAITVRIARAARPVFTTEITRIEVLQGRFASILKAEDGTQLLRSRERLMRSEGWLGRIPTLLIDEATSEQMDRLLAVRGVRRIGRADLLIASICLARAGTLITRNRKDFEKVPGLIIEDWSE